MVRSTILAALLGGSLLLQAQEQPTNSQPRQPQTSGIQMPQRQEQAQAGQVQSADMNKMEQSVTAMSQMCQMMMQKEMQAAPWRYGAIIGLGTLLAIALVLLIVLEVEWVRLWALRLKSEKRKLAQDR